MDINGDGLLDFVRSYKLNPACDPQVGEDPAEKADVKFVYLNTGNGWATSTAYTLPAYIAEGDTTAGAPCYFTGEFIYNEYGNWRGNGQQKQDVVSVVNNSKGGMTSLLYWSSAKYPTATSNRELPISLLVATEMGMSDGQGTTATTSYEYTSGRMFLTQGVRDKKFAGFGYVKATTPDSITTTFYDQANSTDTTAGEQSDGYGQINHPYRKDVADTSENVKQRTFYRWDTTKQGESTFVGLGREIIWDFASNGTHQDKATD